MRKLSNIFVTEEKKEEKPKETSPLLINYDFTTLISNYDRRFLNLGKKFTFLLAPKEIKKVKYFEKETSLLCVYEEEFRERLYLFSSLLDLEIRNCKKVNVSYLSNDSLRNLVIKDVEKIVYDGKFKLKNLNSLVIIDSLVHWKALKCFLKEKRLISLTLINVKIINLPNSYKLLKIIKNMKSLLQIKLINTFSSFFYEIYTQRKFISAEFSDGSMFFIYDNTILTGPSLILKNLPKKFYHLKFSPIRKLVYHANDDYKYLFKENNITGKIEELEIGNIILDNEFILNCKNHLRNLNSLSIFNCTIDFNALYNLFVIFKEDLRNFKIEGSSLPVDFIECCGKYLKNCYVVYKTTIINSIQID